MISGIVTALLLGAFAGIAVWACSARNRRRFDEASRLPLADEPAATGNCRHGGCGCQGGR